MNYEILTDEELVLLSKSGDTKATNKIIERLESDIKKIIKVKNYYLKGGDVEDLIQRGRMAVLSAIKGYKTDKDTKFSTYANKCINNEFNSAIKETKNTPLNDSEPLFGNNLIDDEKNSLVADIRFNPEDNTINEEIEREQKLAIKDVLSKFEYRVYELKELGYKNEAISKELKSDKKAVENAYNRIKQKTPKISDSIKKRDI